MISGDDDEEHTIFINEVYKDRRIPIPDKIKITEEQRVKFIDSIYFFSLYPTLDSNTVYKLLDEDIQYL